MARYRILPACAAILLLPSIALAEGPGHAPGAHHEAPSALWALPFAALLLAIATFPLIHRTHHWWEQNRSKLTVSLILGGLILAYYGLRGDGFHGSAPGVGAVGAVLKHAILDDYIPFLTLLFALYAIAGGMRVTGDLVATPAINTLFLGFGALVASFVGTTGASMVLIRPVLETNQERKRVKHTVVFFIFLVSNIGGSLLPIGDPPLFLGYLQGVPFLWTLNLTPYWALTVALVLAIYYAWDRYEFRHESIESRKADLRHVTRLRVRGGINLLWMAGVVLAVALIVPGRPLPGTAWIVPTYFREGVMIGLTVLSLRTTPRGLRASTQFNYGPILEVACLFLGIFVTMQPPMEILQAKGAAMGLTSPVQFFWATGGLSGVLDNAPTYLVFLQIARTLPLAEGAPAVTLLDGQVATSLLLAISLGSVFMGALTYIGNGPNFMVKTIAEQRGVAMPSFFGYVAYSGAVLIPVFIVVSYLLR